MKVTNPFYHKEWIKEVPPNMFWIELGFFKKGYSKEEGYNITYKID